MNPPDLKYTETHEWVRLSGDTATIGITDHAAHALSDLVYLGLPKKGDKVSAGKACGEIESVKAVSDINSPVDGEVLEVNSALADSLGDITSDPYGKGWLVKIRIKGKAPASLMDASAYDKLVAETA
ncbi:MAG TPA: glycine cleavage system protein GcvH [Planctomycetota bacterium]|jgi:glycine cleavage system H protein|nr:glycine cleavage system protein GcvH [Planctomycetota bacterium]